MRNARFALLIIGSGLGFWLACKDYTAPRIPKEIILAPLDTAIERGTSLQLTATLYDSAGNPIPGLRVEWESLDTSIATVSSTGLVHSKGPAGLAPIRVTRTVLSSTAQVTVLDSLLVARAKLPASSYAAAIFGNVAYVGQTYAQSVRRANFPSRAFTQTVGVGNTPTEMAFNSTGTRLYVTNQYSADISVIDVTTNALIDGIPVGNRPFEVIVEPGDSILWTGKIDSLYGIRLATQQIIARFQIGDVGNGFAIARDTLLYVSTHRTGTVVEVNLRTRTAGRTFVVGGTPQKLAVSANGNELYIANEDGYLQFWSLVTGTQIGANLPLPSAAYGLARRASNGLLYATSAVFGGGYIYVIDPIGRTLIHASAIGGAPRRIVFDASGSTGIVPNEGGWVDFIK